LLLKSIKRVTLFFLTTYPNKQTNKQIKHNFKRKTFPFFFFFYWSTIWLCFISFSFFLLFFLLSFSLFFK
jgi:hypothetical protein